MADAHLANAAASRQKEVDLTFDSIPDTIEAFGALFSDGM